MAQLVLVRFILSISMLVGVICLKEATIENKKSVQTSLSLSCSPGKFACADGSQCIRKSKLCNGRKTCDDLSDELASQCDNCAADHLFRCEHSGVDVCLNLDNKCDGKKSCTDIADERVTVCPNCVDDPSKFTCTARGHKVCLRKDAHKCDGKVDCDDGNDESPSVCDSCSKPGIALCRDGSRCVKASYLCNGEIDCSDGSDESDTWSNCTFCTQNGTVQCPGFPGNCATLCNGEPTCPDAWDELLSNCKSKVSSEVHASICSEEDGLFQCNDGSRCLRKEMVCNAYKDCEDESDESALACKDKCQSKRSKSWPLLPCDNESCIGWPMACSAQIQPLCKDGRDMSDTLCNGKCYTRFPGFEDPYRWPCANGTKKCILLTSRCDGDSDCDDASDEQGCSLVTKLGLAQTLLLWLVIVILSGILFSILIAYSHPLEQDQCLEGSSFCPSTSSPTPFDQALFSFLLHPALSDMDNQSFSWQGVGEQLRIEVVFFNRDPQVILGFLYHIEAQEAHPENVHRAFKGFFSYLESKGYDPITVAINMRQTIGHHRLAHMALKGPPSFIERKLFQLAERVRKLDTKSKRYSLLVSFFRALQTSLSPFLLILDYLKDLILYLILRETVQRLQQNCKHLSALGFDCFSASGSEQDILTALFIIFCISLILTSINSFYLRKRLFKTSFWLNLIFCIVSPLLPAIYHIQLSQISLKLDRQKIKLSNHDLIRRNKKIDTISNSIQQTKEIEVGLELMQILLLLGLVCFSMYVFNAPSGRSYSYSFGIALLVMKGNKVLFLANLLFSFLGPCVFYVNRTNILRHGSLSVKGILVLIARNVLFLLVRVLAITSAIFIPVISQWFVGNQGVDASSLLDDPNLRLEFQKYFRKGLDTLTADTRLNSQCFVLFLFVHSLLVASHALLRSSKFCESMMRERMIHLVSSFWLPLPFLTIRGVDRGEENAELWFLVVLHSIENFLIVFASRAAYLQESYPLGIVIFDYVLVLLNLWGVLMSIIYVSELELYASLPQDLPSLTSFSIEVSFNIYSTQAKAFMIHFQDVPTGYESFSQEESEIYVEGVASPGQAEQEE